MQTETSRKQSPKRVVKKIVSQICRKFTGEHRSGYVMSFFNKVIYFPCFINIYLENKLIKNKFRWKSSSKTSPLFVVL